MEVNFYGPLRTVRTCLPAMRAKGSGSIVLISSGAGYVGVYLLFPSSALAPVYSLAAPLTRCVVREQFHSSPGTSIVFGQQVCH